MKKTTTNFIKKQTDAINIPGNHKETKSPVINKKKSDTKKKTNNPKKQIIQKTQPQINPITTKPCKNSKTNIKPVNKAKETVLRYVKIVNHKQEHNLENLLFSNIIDNTQEQGFELKTKPTEGYIPVLLQKTEENKWKAIAPKTIMPVVKIEQKEPSGYSWITNSKRYQSEDHWINHNADFKNYKNKQLSWQQYNAKIYKKRKKIIEEKFIIPMSKIEENIIEKIIQIINENNLNSYTAKELQKIILDISRQTQKLKQKIETLENNIFFQNKILTKPTDDLAQAYDKTKENLTQLIKPWIQSLRAVLKEQKDMDHY